MCAAVAETEPRAGNQILHGARYKRFARGRCRSHARADVDGNAADIATIEFDFAGVQTCAYHDAQWLECVAHRARAANSACGTVERRKETVARRIDLPPAKPRDLGSRDRGSSTCETQPGTYTRSNGPCPTT